MKKESNSAPTAPAASSKPSPPVVQSQADKIAEFIELADIGTAALLDAGECLVKLYDEDKAVFGKIIAAAPWMTVDILWSFYSIGTHCLHPKVMLYAGTHIYPKLAALSYVEQIKAVCNSETIQKMKEQSKTEKKSKRAIAAKHLTEAQRLGKYNKGVQTTVGRELERKLESAHNKEHGVYQIVIKPGKATQFFKRTGAPIDAQRVRLMKDPDNPNDRIANIELYEYL